MEEKMEINGIIESLINKRGETPSIRAERIAIVKEYFKDKKEEDIEEFIRDLSQKHDVNRRAVLEIIVIIGTDDIIKRCLKEDTLVQLNDMSKYDLMEEVEKNEGKGSFTKGCKEINALIKGIENIPIEEAEERKSKIKDAAKAVEELIGKDEDVYWYFLNMFDVDETTIEIVEQFKDKKRINEYTSNNAMHMTFEQIKKLLPLIENEEDRQGIIETYIKKESTKLEDKVELLKKFGNEEVLKKVIEGPIKIKSLSNKEIAELLAATKNLEYIEKVIEGGIKGVDIFDDNLKYVVNEDILHRIIEGKTERKLDYIEKVELIKATGDKKYIEKLIKGEIKGVYLRFEDRYSLLKEFGSKELLQACIERGKIGVDGLISNDIIGLIEQTGDDKYIEGCKNIISLFYSIYGIDNPEDKKKAIKNATSIIEGLKEEEDVYGFFVNGYLSQTIKIEIVKQFKNKENIKEYIAQKGKEMSFDEKAALIVATSDKYYLRDCILGKIEGISLNDSEKIALIIATKDEEYINKCIEGKIEGLLLNDKMKVALIIATKDEEYIEKCFKGEKEEVKLSRKGLVILAQNMNKEYIENNLEIYFERTVREENNEEKIRVIKKLKGKNEDIISTIDPMILSEKYIKIFTEAQLGEITIYPKLQDDILNANESQLEILKYVMRRVENNEQWYEVIGRISRSFFDEEYTQIYADIQAEYERDGSKEITKIIPNIDKLIQMTMGIGIKKIKSVTGKETPSLGDFQEYLRKTETEDILNLSIEEAKISVLNKIYGISIEEAERLIRTYFSDKDRGKKELDILYGDEEQMVIEGRILSSIETILQAEDIDELKQIEEKIRKDLERFSDIDLSTEMLTLEGNLKKIYLKTYNKTLYDPYKEEDAEKIEEIEGVQVITLDKKFNMMISVVGAYSAYMEPDNFVDAWNIAKQGSRHFCASYIGNDFLGIAEPKGPIYGFLKLEGVLAIGSTDIWSEGERTDEIELFVVNEERVQYQTPKSMITNTLHTHNETDVLRMMQDEKGNWVKKQPDYLVYMQDDTQRDKDDKWVQTLKASKQFGIPIVVIDTKKCLKQEEIEVEKGIKGFIENPQANEVKKIIERYQSNYIGSFYLKIKDNPFTIEGFQEILYKMQNGIENSKLTQQEKSKLYEAMLGVLKSKENDVKGEEKHITSLYSNDKIEDIKENLTKLYKDCLQNEKADTKEGGEVKRLTILTRDIGRFVLTIGLKNIKGNGIGKKNGGGVSRNNKE